MDNFCHDMSSALNEVTAFGENARASKRRRTSIASQRKKRQCPISQTDWEDNDFKKSSDSESELPENFNLARSSNPNTGAKRKLCTTLKWDVNSLTHNNVGLVGSVKPKSIGLRNSNKFNATAGKWRKRELKLDQNNSTSFHRKRKRSNCLRSNMHKKTKTHTCLQAESDEEHTSNSGYSCELADLTDKDAGNVSDDEIFSNFKSEPTKASDSEPIPNANKNTAFNRVLSDMDIEGESRACDDKNEMPDSSPKCSGNDCLVCFFRDLRQL